MDVVSHFANKYPLGTVKSWLTKESRTRLLAAGLKKSLKLSKQLSGHRSAKWPLAERNVLKAFKARRAQGLKV